MNCVLEMGRYIPSVRWVTRLVQEGKGKGSMKGPGRTIEGCCEGYATGARGTARGTGDG